MANLIKNNNNNNNKATDRAVPDMWNLGETATTEVLSEIETETSQIDDEFQYVRFEIDESLSAFEALKLIREFMKTHTLNSEEQGIYADYLQEQKEIDALRKQKREAARAQRLSREYADTATVTSEQFKNAVSNGTATTANMLRVQALKAQNKLAHQQLLAASKPIEISNIGEQVEAQLGEQRDRIVQGAIGNLQADIEATSDVLTAEEIARKKLRDFNRDTAIKQIQAATDAIVGNTTELKTANVGGEAIEVQATTI